MPGDKDPGPARFARLFLVTTTGWLLAGALPARIAAQAVSPAAATRDEPVMLSAFEVSPQGDDGYKAANAISGTRFNVPLLDLPRPIEVITAEFIEDIGAKEIGEAL